MNEQEIQTLEAKIQRFTGELTPEEQERLRAIQAQPRDVTGLMATPLWDKAQQVADALTPEEEAALRRVLRHAGVTAVGSDEVDMYGYRAAEYDDGTGNKGRGPGGVTRVGGGGLGVKHILLGALLLVTAGGVSYTVHDT